MPSASGPGPTPAGLEALGQDVPDQRGLARARHAGDDVEGAEPELDVDGLQIVLAGAEDPEASRAGPAAGADRGGPVAGQEIPGRACPSRQLQQAGGRTLIEDPAARVARARPEVDDVVGRAHDVFVVLDDEDGVAVVPKLADDVEQPGRVGRMKSGGRLVEDVENAAQPASGLRSEPDALDLAAGERVRGPVEAQIAEPEPLEQVRSFQERLADGLSGGPGRTLERHASDLAGQAADAHRAEIGDGPARDGHPEGFRPEPPAAAGAAGQRPGEAEDVVVPLRLQDGLHDRQDALVEPFFPGLGDDALPAHPRFERVLAVADEDAVAAVEDDVALLVRQVLPGDVDGEAVGPADLGRGRPWSPGNR